jgi:tRNA threonylcarbamoyladenosine biosynthesis protein TsaE
MPKIFFDQPLFLSSVDHTKTLAQRLGRQLKNGDIVTLEGPLGSGKTTFARFLIQSLVQKPIDVTSPTFNLVQIYDTPTYPIWHFDLYRLKNEEELFETGFEEALSHGVLLIEWPCRAGSFLPENRLNLKFSIEQEHEHHVKLTPSGTWKTRVFNE